MSHCLLLIDKVNISELNIFDMEVLLPNTCLLRYYWLLPWLSSTHNQLEELARHNMILSTSSTSMHK